MAAFIPVLPAPEEWTSGVIPLVEADVRRLLGDQGTRLVVDLSVTTFLSSAALTTLIHLGKRLAEAGGGIALARPTPTVVKLLRAVGLTRVLRVFDGIDEARAALAPARPPGGRA